MAAHPAPTPAAPAVPASRAAARARKAHQPVATTTPTPTPTPTPTQQQTDRATTDANANVQEPAPPRASHVAHEPLLPPPSSSRPETTTAAADGDRPSHQLHWRAHSDHHFAVRKQMIGRLQRLHPLLATNTTMRYAGQLTRIPELVQRLELMLYKAAASLDEYTNVCTLERRVHSLVTLLEPLPPVATPRKRRFGGGSAGAGSLPCKRRRRCNSLPARTSLTTVGSSTKDASPSPTHCCLTSELNGDLLGLVFAFVDGVDTLRSCALVNRFFHRAAPRLVRSLRIDVADPSHARALHGRVARVLPACEQLTSLTITNSRSVGKKHGFTRAFQTGEHDAALGSVIGTPAAFAAAADPLLFTGRVLLHELSDLLLDSHRVVFPKLQSLELSSPFDCANEADSTLQCLHALAVNVSRQDKALRRLQRLVLDTTVLGDRRMPRLLALFHEFPLVFTHQLRSLMLRNNFVGEAGMAALARSLAGGWPRLETLSLRRNVLTDGDAQQLAFALPRGLPSLQLLDVSENFIGKPGFEALAQPLKASAAVAHVSIQTSHNCMESAEAANLFM